MCKREILEKFSNYVAREYSGIACGEELTLDQALAELKREEEAHLFYSGVVRGLTDARKMYTRIITEQIRNVFDSQVNSEIELNKKVLQRLTPQPRKE